MATAAQNRRLAEQKAEEARKRQQAADIAKGRQQATTATGRSQLAAEREASKASEVAKQAAKDEQLRKSRSAASGFQRPGIESSVQRDEREALARDQKAAAEAGLDPGTVESPTQKRDRERSELDERIRLEGEAAQRFTERTSERIEGVRGATAVKASRPLGSAGSFSLGQLPATVGKELTRQSQELNAAFNTSQRNIERLKRELASTTISESFRDNVQEALALEEAALAETQGKLSSATKDAESGARGLQAEIDAARDTFFENSEKLGDGFGGLDNGQVEASIAGTGLSLSFGLAFRDTQKAIKEARERKDELAIATSQATLEKLQREATETGAVEQEKITKFSNAIQGLVTSGKLSQNDADAALQEELGIRAEALDPIQERKDEAQARKDEAAADLAELELKEAKQDGTFEEVIMGKGQDNTVLGKSGGSLTWRSNNPLAISSAAGDVDDAERLAAKFGAIPGVFTTDALGKFLPVFETEADGEAAAFQLLDQNAARAENLEDLAQIHTGTGAQGHIAKMKQAGLNTDLKYENLTDGDKQLVLDAFKEAERFTPGETIDPTKSAPVVISQQLRGQVRTLLSRSGFGTLPERAQAEKDFLNEIASGRASTPLEAKKNLGVVTDDDKEVKTRIKEDFTFFKRQAGKGLQKARQGLAILEAGSGVGDLAAIVSFLKTIDPPSVAREGEVANVEGASGVLNKIAFSPEKLVTGAKLPPQAREELKEAFEIMRESLLSREYELLISAQSELDERGVEATIVDTRRIPIIESSLGAEAANKVRDELGLDRLPVVVSREEALEGVRSALSGSGTSTFTPEENAEADEIFG